MRHVGIPFEGRVAETPVSPGTLVSIADAALAMGDVETAARFIEMAYQANDDELGGAETGNPSAMSDTSDQRQ